LYVFKKTSNGKGNTAINNGIRSSLSRQRMTVSMQYVGNPLIDS